MNINLIVQIKFKPECCHFKNQPFHFDMQIFKITNLKDSKDSVPLKILYSDRTCQYSKFKNIFNLGQLIRRKSRWNY